MKTVTLIGTSHTGALKHGWNVVGPLPNVNLNYIVAKQAVHSRLTLTPELTYGVVLGTEVDKHERDALKARSGDTVFDLNTPDTVILIGMSSEPDFVRELLQECDVDGLRETGAATLLSIDAFDAILEEHCQRLMPDVGWHNWSGTNLIYVETPRRCETALSKKRKKPEVATGYPEAFQRVSDRLAHMMEAKGILYIPQPPNTISGNGLTKAEFSVGSVRFFSNTGHEGTDTAHMNPDYGAEVWKKILPHL